MSGNKLNERTKGSCQNKINGQPAHLRGVPDNKKLLSGTLLDNNLFLNINNIA